MLYLFRPRALAALFVAFAALFATPAFAAEGQAAPAAASVSISSLPSFSTVSTPQVPGDVLERQQTAPAVSTAPLRPLRDLVISFVNYGNQDAEQLCLAKAVYFEARSESLEGQLAVAEVVLNRSVSGMYPPSICGVVTQPAQFSFVHAGRMPEPKTDSDAWHRALAIAEIASKKLASQLDRGVLWYHATYVSPSWGRAKTRAAKIGTHIFYS